MRRSPLLAVVVLVVTSCGAVMASELESHPEAHLRYPGSSVVSVIHTDESTSSDSLGGPQMVEAARAGAFLDAHASIDQIHTWYERWLVAHGWHPVAGAITDYERGDREVYSIGAGGEMLRDHDPTATAYYAYYSVTPQDCHPHQIACWR